MFLCLDIYKTRDFLTFA